MRDEGILVNSRDPAHGDEIDLGDCGRPVDGSQPDRSLRSHGLGWSADDLTPLRDLRESLQDQLRDGRGSAEPPAPRSNLTRHLANLSWKVKLGEGQLVLAAEGAGWRQVAGTLVTDILLAQQHDLWPRLKVCRNPPCSVVFYDSSKNQSRVWCNTSVCGNIHNLRASRARRREQDSLAEEMLEEAGRASGGRSQVAADVEHTSKRRH